MQVDKDAVINKILESSFFPEDLKHLIKYGQPKMSVSIVNTKWIIHLYNVRKDWISGQLGYEKVVVDLSRTLERMRLAGDKLYLINLIASNKFLLLFLNEDITELIGVLDLSGKGNTKAFIP